MNPDLSGSPAEIYERYGVPRLFLPWGRDLLDLVAPKPGERVLDVACGTGAVTRLLALRVEPGGRVVGLDVNAGMLSVGRSLVTHPSVDWREASALELPFDDGSFDVVICQQGLQFFPDRSLALRQMRRVLIPGGRLGVSCWCASAESPPYAAIERALARRLGADHAKLPPFGLSDGEQVRQLIQQAGFREVRIHGGTKTVHWPSTNVLVRATAAMSPALLGPLAEQGDAVLSEIVAEVDAEMGPFHEPGGGIRFPVGNNMLAARA